MPKGKIMVVDDEEDVRETIKLQLEAENYNVIEAENGEEAIKLLRSEDNLMNCGLILCDIRMPKVNGIEYIDYLKEQAPGIPVVVITGYPDTELAVGLMNKGVKDYLVKPVESEKLMKVVNKLIAEGRDFDVN
jgi:two-component system chemotaxis response regulator CheY